MTWARQVRYKSTSTRKLSMLSKQYWGDNMLVESKYLLSGFMVTRVMFLLTRLHLPHHVLQSLQLGRLLLKLKGLSPLFHLVGDASIYEPHTTTMKTNRKRESTLRSDGTSHRSNDLRTPRFHRSIVSYRLLANFLVELLFRIPDITSSVVLLVR